MMEDNLYHQGDANIWNIGPGETYQLPQSSYELSGCLPSLRSHVPTNSNKQLIELSSSLPHSFFNTVPQYQSSSGDAYTYINPNQHHCVSSLQAGLGKTNGGDALPTWSNVKVRPEVTVQIPHLEGKSSLNPALCQKLQQKSGVVTTMSHFQAVATESSEHLGTFGEERVKLPLPVRIRGFGALNQARVKGTINKRKSREDTHNQHKDSFDDMTAQLDQSKAQKTQSPPQKKHRQKKRSGSVKKRTKDEDSWARNIRKNARSKGESYTSVRGKTIPARSVKPVDCSKCKYNCPSRVSEEERWRHFREFWGLVSFEDKVNYISNSIHEFAPLRPVSGRKSFSRRYMLRVKGKDERVCKDFFTSTFGISESTVVTYMTKKRMGPEALADLRGKRTPSNKTPDCVVRKIREHILSQTGLQGGFALPVEGDESHRIKTLYSHYQTECHTDGIKAASISVYRKIYSDLLTDKRHATLNEYPLDTASFSGHHKDMKQQPAANKEGTCSRAVADVEEFVSLPSNPLKNLRSDAAFKSSQGCTDRVITAEKLPLNLNNVPNYFHKRSDQITSFNQNLENSLEQSQPNSHQLGNHNLQSNQCHKPSYFVAYQNQNKSGIGLPLRPDNNHDSSLCEDSSRIFGSAIHNDFDVAYETSEHLMQNPLAQTISVLTSMVSSSSLRPSHKSSTSPTLAVLPPTILAINSSTSNTNGIGKAGKGSSSNCRKKMGKNSQKQPSKRSRNEEAWGRNIRKRLRFKGEAYTSVRGKQVGAKVVQEVDCSKCKFKCPTKISEDQRQELNKHYWNLDTYKERILFLTKHVEAYTPKRRMTGRRAFSRKYFFEVGSSAVRVCKDFFMATLHVSESTVATALEKSRNGPDSIVDMRGRHRPSNKTPEETLQDIRELIIYVTGVRPHRPANNASIKPEFCDVNHLYRIYKYDCQKKGKRAAGLGIFRTVLSENFSLREALPEKTSRSKLGKKAPDNRTKKLKGKTNGQTTHAVHSRFRPEAMGNYLPLTAPELISCSGNINSSPVPARGGNVPCVILTG